jgi:iron complex outermembrane recepter protein
VCAIAALGLVYFSDIVSDCRALARGVCAWRIEMRMLNPLRLGVGALLVSGSALASDAPLRTLGTVTVIGTRPTSLPTQIPTTIEGVDAAQIADAINAADAEDALKYLPSLLVRKRYIGDYDHAVLASRASGTGNSARSLVYADGILLSNLLGNGATFTPRWGMVTPEEIARVDVLYGPFSAAYPGNSVGAVVDYVTRMPTDFEAHVRFASFVQQSSLYGYDDSYYGYQASASIGDQIGPWSWWLNYNRLESEGQPLGFANKLVSATPATNEPVVTGAVAGRNPLGQDWLLIGATNQNDIVQDHAKLKLAYEVSPTLRASYTLGAWFNDGVRRTESYLADANGVPVYGQLGSAAPLPVNVGGNRYTVLPTDFAPGLTELEHFIHGFALKADTGAEFAWEIAASLYDYARDEVRTPSVAVASAATHGPGRIADQGGTGWNTLSLRTTWRPTGIAGAHLIEGGYQRFASHLRAQVFETADWIDGAAAARTSLFTGDTELQALYAQDTWRIADRWRATLGLRAERWRAFGGRIANANSSSTFPERDETDFSPKVALAYQWSDDWTLQASLGRAVRAPTVSELYQGTLVAAQIVNNDPNLRAEKSWTLELTALRDFMAGSLRATLFAEDTRDALYSQVNATIGGTVQTIQNVDDIETRGLELAYQMSDVLLPGFDLMTSLTYAHSEIVANDNFPASVGKRQPRVPNWRANGLATYRIGEKWVASVGARYSGRQYNRLDNADHNGTAYTGLSNFFVIDARLRYRMTPQCTVSIGVDNLNNDKYWAFHPYPQRSAMAEVSVDF